MITIGIPTIGESDLEYLNKSIKSALDTDENIVDEIIILDNSQDTKISRLLHELTDNVDRVVIQESVKRLKMGENWNELLKIAKNNWIIYLHDDDYLISENINGELLSVLNEKKGFITCNYYIDDKEKSNKLIIRNGNYTPGTDTPKFVSTLINVRFLKEIGGWDDNAGAFLDALAFNKLHVIYGSSAHPMTLGAYRKHQGNASEESKRNITYGNYFPYVLNETFKIIDDPVLRKNIIMHAVSYIYPERDSKLKKICLRLCNAINKITNNQ